MGNEPGAWAIRLLDAYDVEVSGKHAVVIGRSPILGRPVGMLLLERDATVTYGHSHTCGLPEIVRSADVVVAAVGQPRFVRGDWLKAGAVVIDAGYNEGNVGDVAFDEALSKASLLTPVPGGVGPMTIAVLLQQTVVAAESRICSRRAGRAPGVDEAYIEILEMTDVTRRDGCFPGKCDPRYLRAPYLDGLA